MGVLNVMINLLLGSSGREWWLGGGDAEGSNCVKSLGDIRQPVEQSGNLWHSLLKSMMTSLTPPSSNTKLNCCIMSQQEESLQADK